MKANEQVFNAAMNGDLMTFVHRCFTELNPGQDFSYAPHLIVMAAKLQACLLGKGPKRLIISLPPRSLKSMTVSVAAVAWLMGLDPTKQVICASYGQELADKQARDTRTIMTSTFFKQAFPRTRLLPSKLSVNDFMTTEQGFRMATSIGGVLTGRGGDVLIIDDPLKPEEALSETSRAAVNDRYDNTFLSRLNSKENGIIIIVMQRLHQDDLVGHVLDRGEDWDVLSFPAIAEEDQTFSVQTMAGPYVYNRLKGEVLDPSRESLASLLQTRSQVGEYTFASQYQQSPTPMGGAMVKTDWLRYYSPPLGFVDSRYRSIMPAALAPVKVVPDLTKFRCCALCQSISGDRSQCAFTLSLLPPPCSPPASPPTPTRSPTTSPLLRTRSLPRQ